ncbi:MAG: DUF2169 domain-containing protein [Polyangiaceae bacterium]
MSRITTGVSTEGPVTAGVVAWRVGARIRATVVVKACFEFTTSGQCSLVRPLPIFVKDRVAVTGELSAPSDVAPFVPSPEVMVIGRALHRHGTSRVGYRLERAGTTIVEEHADAAPNAALAAFAPRPSAWPVPPEAFEAGVVTLPSPDGAPFQRCDAEQRVTELRGNEEVVLIGLYPNAPLLRFPLFAPTVEATALSGEHADAVPLRIDALIVTLADRRCTMLWRGSVPLRSEEALATLAVKVVARPDPRSSAPRPTEQAPRANGTPRWGRSPSPRLQNDHARRGALRERVEAIDAPIPKSQPPPVSAPASREGTPWAAGGAPSKGVRPAQAAMSTMPIEEDEPPAPQPAPSVSVAPSPVPAPSSPPAAREEPAASGGPVSVVAPPSRDPDRPLWREDPRDAEPPPAAPSVAPKPVKKDLNAQLYKRPKLKR